MADEQGWTRGDIGSWVGVLLCIIIVGKPRNLTSSGVSVGTFCRAHTLSRHRAYSGETTAARLPFSGDMLGRGLPAGEICVPMSKTLTGF
jgi:hypothetical protein